MKPLPDTTSAPVVRRALAAAFPDIPLKAPKLLLAGDEYVTWAAGSHVVKFPQTSEDAARLEREPVVHALAVGRLGPLVPAMTALGAPTDEFPLSIGLYERARGRQGQQSDGPVLSPKPWARVGLAKATAAALSSLHGTPATAARRAGVPKVALDLDPGFDVSDEALAWATRIVGEAVDAFLIDPLPSEARTKAAQVLCHGDLKGEHVFVSEDGTRLTAIIDWREARISDPATDLAGLAIPAPLGDRLDRPALPRGVAPLEHDDDALARGLHPLLEVAELGLQALELLLVGLRLHLASLLHGSPLRVPRKGIISPAGGAPMDMVEPFVALVIYPTTPDAQSRQADNLARIASEKVRALPGFRRSRVFVSEDGESLVTLTEWSDRESFQQFRQSEFGQAAIRLAADLRPQAHWLRQHATVEAP